MVSTNGEAKIMTTWTHGIKSDFPEPQFACQNIPDYKYFHENPETVYLQATRAPTGDIQSYEYFG